MSFQTSPQICISIKCPETKQGWETGKDSHRQRWEAESSLCEGGREDVPVLAPVDPRKIPVVKVAGEGDDLLPKARWNTHKSWVLTRR